MFVIAILGKLNQMMKRAEKAEQKLSEYEKKYSDIKESMKDFAIDLGALPSSAKSMPYGENFIMERIRDFVNERQLEVDSIHETNNTLLKGMGYLHARIAEAAYFSDVEEVAAEQKEIFEDDKDYQEGFTIGLAYAEALRRSNAQHITRNELRISQS